MQEGGLGHRWMRRNGRLRVLVVLDPHNRFQRLLHGLFFALSADAVWDSERLCEVPRRPSTLTPGILGTLDIVFGVVGGGVKAVVVVVTAVKWSS